MSVPADRRTKSAWTTLLLVLVVAFPAAARAQSYTWRNVRDRAAAASCPASSSNQRSPTSSTPAPTSAAPTAGTRPRSRWIPLLDWVGWDDWNLTGVDSLATDPVRPEPRLRRGRHVHQHLGRRNNGAILRSDRPGQHLAGARRCRSSRRQHARAATWASGWPSTPTATAILYLGARSGNGLWRSTDFGVTWAKVTSFPDRRHLRAGPERPQRLPERHHGVVWVMFDPRTGTAGNTTQTIYVGVADQGTSVYRSTDGGATWSALPGQPTGFMPHKGVLGPNGMLYVTYSDTGGPYDGEKGDVWKLRHRHRRLDADQPDPVQHRRRLLRLRRPDRRRAAPRTRSWWRR